MKDTHKVLGVLILIMMATIYQLGQSSVQEEEPVPVHVPASQSFFQAPLHVEAAPLPEENPIRIRVIPHSNAHDDQVAKRVVTYGIEEFLTANNASLLDVESTRNFVAGNMALIEGRISQILDSIGYTLDFEVAYGQHQFPEKIFNGTVLPAGHYESLVIRIGEGRGSNWWCFINPGVCLGPAVAELESTATGWNELNNVFVNTQAAIQDHDFASYLSGFLGNLFGGRTAEAAGGKTRQAAEPARTQATPSSLFLFDDEK